MGTQQQQPLRQNGRQVKGHPPAPSLENRAENPFTKAQELPEEDQVVKQITGVLNKVTPEKYEQLLARYVACPSFALNGGRSPAGTVQQSGVLCTESGVCDPGAARMRSMEGDHQPAQYSNLVFCAPRAGCVTPGQPEMTKGREFADQRDHYSSLFMG